MPIVGHAFVGVATALEAAPRTGIPRRAALWVPALVGLAYCPDIIYQVLSMTALRPWAERGHSVILVLPLSLVLAWPLSLTFGLTRRRAVAICLVSLLLHIIPDALTGSAHEFLWPVSTARQGFALRERGRLLVELFVFSGLSIAYLYVRWWRPPARRALLRAQWAGFDVRHHGIAAALTVCILVAAATTHAMGIVREHQLRKAWQASDRKEYGAALALLEEGFRWPLSAHDGCLDFSRAETYMRMKDRLSAERCYLRSYAANSSSFWCVVGLAEFYATSGEPLDVRRRNAEPYIRQLDMQFCRERWYTSIRAKLDRRLEWPASSPVTGQK